jgi:hypothetical protein
MEQFAEFVLERYHGVVLSLILDVRGDKWHILRAD